MTYSQLSDPEGARLRNELAIPTPFVVESGAPNARLRAQEGFFITGAVPTRPSEPEIVSPTGTRISRVTITPFESIDIKWPQIDQSALSRRLLAPGRGAPRSLPFVAIIINAAMKGKLLNYLEGTYNQSARVLFPDYEGYRSFGRHANG